MIQGDGESVSRSSQSDKDELEFRLTRGYEINIEPTLGTYYITDIMNPAILVSHKISSTGFELHLHADVGSIGVSHYWVYVKQQEYHFLCLQQ
jgi:hypothetical protein